MPSAQEIYTGLYVQLRRGEVVPFLGAGASAGGNESGNGLPTGTQLANRLASILEIDKSSLYKEGIDADDLIEVASSFVLYRDREELELELKEIFGRMGTPGPLHRFIAELKRPPRVIVTTNYDTLIEQAFRQADRAFHLVMTSVKKDALMWWGPGELVARAFGDPRELDARSWPSDIPIIYKIHGGLTPSGGWVSSIITEDDYFEMAGRTYASSLLPPLITDILLSSSFLFLGYSLRDPHVRFLVGKVARWSAGRHHLVSKTLSEMNKMRCRNLRVRVIELAIADFLERLTAVGQSEIIRRGLRAYVGVED